jgi:hypothetical protein
MTFLKASLVALATSKAGEFVELLPKELRDGQSPNPER